MEDWKELFAFNRSERRGLLVLLIFLFVQIITLFLYANREFDSPLVSVIPLQNFADSMENKENLETKSFSKQINNSVVDYFLFNPNNASQETFMHLGLSEKQAITLINYRKKGGVFRKKRDLAKIYSVSEEQYLKLEPWIDLPLEWKTNKIYKENKSEWKSKGNYSKSEKKEIVIEINSSQIADFKKLKGIGEVYAKRIIKYRDILGGFFSIDQIEEVYGIEQQTFNDIKPLLTVDPGMLKNISINYAPYRELLKHPYIDNKLAYVITEERKKQVFTSFTELEQRLASMINIDQRLSHYLKFEK